MDLVVLVSGRGSNLEALLTAIENGRCRARVSAVISDRPQAQALALATARGIPTQIVKPADYADREAWDHALSAAVAEFAPGLVVLAGFMRLIGASMLSRFGGRVINVHPALLPAFPGMDAPAQAIAKRVSMSGCTVHVVDAGVDSGPILSQAAVPVLEGDDEASLHARIQKAEHALLPAVVDAIATGQLSLDGPVPRYVGSTDGAERMFAWPPLI